jgi:tripartite-type tricarboxylate transporter receptor subunit TctC
VEAPVPKRSTFARHVHLIIGLAAVACSAVAAAQGYPTKPVRIIVGFPPGGGVDIVTRLIGSELQKALGQPVVVENRPGVAGSLGAELVAKSAADGYTLLMGNTGSLAINPALYNKIAYDTQRDFAPVALVATSPLVVLVHPSVPATSLGEFVALAKQRPGTINFGSGGSGGITHLTAELLKMQAGLDMVHVPYKGSAPAITDLVGGQLQMMVEGIPLAAPYVQSSKLRALAVTSAKRSSSLSDVPTVAEAGFPELVVTAWYGLVVPASTPAAVVARLNETVNAVLAESAFKDKLLQNGADAAGGTPAQFGDLLRRELALWAKAVKASGAKVE